MSKPETNELLGPFQLTSFRIFYSSFAIYFGREKLFRLTEAFHTHTHTRHSPFGKFMTWKMDSQAIAEKMLKIVILF